MEAIMHETPISTCLFLLSLHLQALTQSGSFSLPLSLKSTKMVRSLKIIGAPTITFFFFFSILISHFLPFSFSQDFTGESVSPDQACSLTLNPSFCRSLIPSQSRSNLHGYGRYLVEKSLRQSATFSSLIDRTIRDNASLPSQAAGALADCFLLSQLTTDFLLSSLATLDSNTTTTTNLPDDQADDKVQTLLSAIVTNQETCLEGLTQANFSQRGHKLYAPLENGTQLYSLSLAVLTRSWATQKAKRERQLLDELRVRGDGVPRWVNKQALEFASGRRMALQTVGSVVVAQDGSGNYRTIGDAIAAAPLKNDGSKGFFLIRVKAGVYNEYVTVDKKKKFVMMVGDGAGRTIITGQRSVGDGSTTFNSATLAVLGQGFVGIGITVRNTAGRTKGQAVAVRNGADLSAFYKCSFEGYQDTLYAHSLRQFYRDCDVYGTVDFIFGNAAAVFQNCNLYARLPNGNINTVTAQGRTDPNQNTGTSFINCNVLATSELSGNSKVKTFLGRPWRQYSRVVFMKSNLGSLINPAGWSPWSGNFALGTLYYGEYGNSGPGSGTAGRVKWAGFHVMAANDAQRFTVSSFVQGGDWLPRTTVPFTAGLV